MSEKRWVVELCDAERLELDRLINTGRTAARTILKARILLKADQASGSGWTDTQIADALETSITHVANTRRKLVEHGMEAVFTRKKRTTPPRKCIFDGEAEAKLIRLACSTPPAGRARWTIRLLADKAVELKIVETTHFNTVGRVLKKHFETASE